MNGKKSSKREFRDALEVQLELDSYKEVWQQRPYTAVRVVAKLGEVPYEGLGFSKVCWPDAWDPELGVERAKRKAIRTIAKDILRKDAPETIKPYLFGYTGTCLEETNAS